MLWEKLLSDIGYGYKKMFMAIGFFILVCAMAWGFISAILTVVGAMKFQWWNIPCWVLALTAIAGCFGAYR